MTLSGFELWSSVAVLIAIGVSVGAVCFKRVRPKEPSKDAASLREAYSELAAISHVKLCEAFAVPLSSCGV